MKKPIRIISMALVLILLSTTTAMAVSFSFSDAKGMVSAIKIDGQSIFESPDNIRINESSEFTTLFRHSIKGGAMLNIFVDKSTAWLLLFKQDSYDGAEWWGKYDMGGSDSIPMVLATILQDYLDYDEGACFTINFMDYGTHTLSRRSLQYSPVFTDADSITVFNDMEAFCNAAGEIIRHIRTIQTSNGKVEDIYSYLDESSREPIVSEAGETNKEDADEPGANDASSTAGLKRGDKGEAVTALQEKLNAIGYDVGKTDGDFGKKTETAIIHFQSDHQLEQTGVADSKTVELINNIAFITEDLLRIREAQTASQLVVVKGAKLANVMAYTALLPGGLDIIKDYGKASETMGIPLKKDSIPYGWIMVKEGYELRVAYQAQDTTIAVCYSVFNSGGGSYMSTVIQECAKQGLDEDCTFVNMDSGEVHFFHPPKGLFFPAYGTKHTSHEELSNFCKALQESVD